MIAPISSGTSATSSRSCARCLSGPWQWKQLSERMGLTSRLKLTGAGVSPLEEVPHNAIARQTSAHGKCALGTSRARAQIDTRPGCLAEYTGVNAMSFIVLELSYVAEPREYSYALISLTLQRRLGALQRRMEPPSRIEKLNLTRNET